MPYTYPTPNQPTQHDDARPDASKIPCPFCGNQVALDAPCVAPVRCARCDARTPCCQNTRTVRGSTVCPLCLAEAYWQCYACDGWNRAADACGTGCDDDDEPDDDDKPAGVYPYEYKPQPLFHGIGPLYLGAEIEVQTSYRNNADCVRVAYQHLGNLAYLKADSSIGGGFEIVTHPMSYEWALRKFPWELFPDLALMGCTTGAGTGLHVHLSRAGFSGPPHMYRWMKFIYRNERPVCEVAGRSSDEWAAFTSRDRAAAKYYAKGGMSNRHRAINTGNADTFELRVFASSLEPSELQAMLGFAHASVEYTRSLSTPQIRDGGWEWRAFTGWVGRQADYQPLRERLEALSCAS